MTESTLRTSKKLTKPHIYFSSAGLPNKGCWAYNPALVTGISSLRVIRRRRDFNLKAYDFVRVMYNKRKWSNDLF